MKSEEATQSIEYSRTVVPSSMRSAYWKYFGFPSDNANNVLTKQKIICTLCNTAIAYNKNTSNLRTHLIAKHCEMFHELHLQQQDHNAQLARKRTNSGMVVLQANEAGDNNYMENKAKEDNYTLTSVPVLECIEADYKQHTLIVEGDDVVEMIDQPTEGIPDVDAVNFEDYAAALQTGEALVEQAQKQGNVDEVEQDADDTYAFSKVGSVCPSHITAGESMAAPDLEDIVVDMLVTDLLPSNTIAGQGFILMVNQFGSLNKSSVDFKLTTQYNIMYEEVFGHLRMVAQSQPYSLSVELCKNVDNLTVICIYINYYSVEESQILSVLYQNQVMTEDFTHLNNCSDFQSIFKDLNLTKCAAVVLNEPNSIIEMFFRSLDIPIVACLESVLARCISRIFELPRVKSQFNTVLQIAERCVKAATNMLIEMPEVYPQCPWSKLQFLQFCNENLSFSSPDNSVVLDKARELVEYIYPLKVTLETISDEPLSLCSLMRPFTIRLLGKDFSAYFTEEDYLSDVKHILNDELTNSILSNEFLNEATFFDVRFLHDFLDNEDMDTIKAEICKRFKSLIDNVVESTETPAKREFNVNCTNGSNRKSSLKSFFQRKAEGNHDPVTMKKLYIEQEFRKYNCEPALDLEHCPVSWWQENRHTFKYLKQIAEYYLSVPCCVNRLFKYSVSERNELQNKRFMLRNQKAQELWYLHYNKSFYEMMNRH